MISLETMSELNDRARKLEQNGGPVQLVEAACYRVIAEYGNKCSPDWTLIGQGEGMLVPTIYETIAPEIVEYAGAVSEFRNEATESVGRIWDRISMATGSQDLLIRARESIKKFPAVMLSLSPTERSRTAELLGLPERVISMALTATPWWKASEHVEWRNWADPSHDIVSWVTRDQDLAVLTAMQNHYWHEANHHAIDFISSTCGWSPSNFLTEGTCEYWSADSRVMTYHSRLLRQEFGVLSNVTWSGISQKLHSQSSFIEFPDYTYGWASVYAASASLVGSRPIEAGFGTMLLELHNHAIPGDLIGTFERLFQEKIISEQTFNSVLQNRVERSLLS